jgi:tRNA threonylcarbamoyladenosine biosynthesis protein TsaE
VTRGRFTTRSEGATKALARDLAGGLRPGTTLLLSGDLGAGKTVFVKGLAEGLGISGDEVTSPTFTLVHLYRGGRFPLVHVDLYRLERADIADLGLDAEVAADGVVAIEWPERLVRPIERALQVHLAMGDDENTRFIEITR